MTTTRRRLGLLAIASATLAHAHEDEHEPPIARTALIHGTAGPFAVAGYRMGEHAMRTLSLERGAMDIDVTHYSPAVVQWSCVIDGLQAATGASLGKMNLHRVDSKEVYSVVKNKKTGQQLRFELAPSFLKMHANLPYDKLYEAGLGVVKMRESEVFRVR